MNCNRSLRCAFGWAIVLFATNELSYDVFAQATGASTSSQTPAAAGGADATKQAVLPGTEEFGLSPKELVQAIEKVEALIAKGMKEQGFEYVAADYRTVRKAMVSEKSLPGMTEREFVAKHGFGISTMYTGQPPQLAEGFNAAKMGLGEKNIEIYKGLSPADRVAYNRALFGENLDSTFAMALEREDFSRCGGCTRKAIEQVFTPEQMKSTYYNPKDALIRKDPRMKAALREFADKMRAAGFAYNDPDEVETDLRRRLIAITGPGTPPVESLSPDQQTALKKLQEDERRVAVLAFKMQEDIFDPVEEKIEKELYARDLQ